MRVGGKHARWGGGGGGHDASYKNSLPFDLLGEYEYEGQEGLPFTPRRPAPIADDKDERPAHDALSSRPPPARGRRLGSQPWVEGCCTPFGSDCAAGRRPPWSGRLDDTKKAVHTAHSSLDWRTPRPNKTRDDRQQLEQPREYCTTKNVIHRIPAFAPRAGEGGKGELTDYKSRCAQRRWEESQCAQRRRGRLNHPL